MGKRKRILLRILTVILACYLLFWSVPTLPYLIAGGLHPGNIWSAAVDAGHSERFSPLEISLAMGRVFALVYGFEDSTLRRAWYDEQRCNAEFDETDANRILLMFDFDTGNSPAVAGLNPDFPYRNWSMSLRRFNRFCPWFVQSFGFA